MSSASAALICDFSRRTELCSGSKSSLYRGTSAMFAYCHSKAWSSSCAARSKAVFNDALLKLPDKANSLGFTRCAFNMVRARAAAPRCRSSERGQVEQQKFSFRAGVQAQSRTVGKGQTVARVQIRTLRGRLCRVACVYGTTQHLKPVLPSRSERLIQGRACAQPRPSQMCVLPQFDRR